MLTKLKLANGLTRVTFEMPALEGAKSVTLVGEFNNWDVAASPMKQKADGKWVVELKLEANRSYQYRYLVNDQEWHNDWAADAYVSNPFGADNSILVLEDTKSRKDRTTQKKTSSQSAAGKAST